MFRIEVALEKHFADNALPSPTANAHTPRAESSSSAASESSFETPFAKVNSVESNSPAQIAGLRVGDRIQRFGEADWLNHDKLAKVAQIVSRSEGVSQVE